MKLLMLKMCNFVNNTKHSRIDKCMNPLIKFLESIDYKIVACCCGHNKYPMTIIAEFVDDGWKYYKELLSDIRIYRKRRFYEKDKQGMYFIPEIIKNG